MSQVRTRHDKGVNLIPENIEGVGGEDLSIEGDLSVDSSDSELKVRLDGSTRTVVTEDQAQKLENKVIDSDKNVITNIVTDDLKAGVLNTSPSLSGATDVQIPSAKAVKEYVDASSGQVQADVDDLITLSGVPANSTDLGSFTGSVIPDDQTVKEALQALETASENNSNLILDVSQDLQDHVNNPTGAHTASAISVTPTGTIGSTDVQSAIEELNFDTVALTNLVQDIDTAVGTHISSTSDVHGAIGEVVGTGNIQTLENKTLEYPVINQGSINGTSINNPYRAGVKEGTKAVLTTYAMTASNGQLVFATDEKKLYQIIDNKLAAVGSGEGGGLDTYYTQSMEDLNDTFDFDKGNSPDFMGGGILDGSLTIEELQPIAGAKSLKYTQGASSINDYFASPIIEIDPKQQGNTSGMTFYFEYDGNDNDGRFIVYDVDNAKEIASEVNFVKKEGIATRYQLSFWVPENCSQIRWGYKVLVANSGKSLVMDDVEMSTNPFMYKNISNASRVIVKTYNSGSNWYEISNDGWIRQGGYVQKGTLSATVPVVFLVNMEDTSYSISGAMDSNSSSTGVQFQYSSIITTAKSTSGFQTSRSVDIGKYWMVEGYASSSSLTSLGIIIGPPTTEHILTPSDTFSTDTAQLNWAAPAQYNLTTLENAPIGTYITFQYAANTITRTQCTTRPTQTDTDMNVNGMHIFTRAYNAASTAAQPTTFAIQIGKGMKDTSLNIYKSLGKVIAGSLDIHTSGIAPVDWQGLRIKDYNENTGIIVLDSGSAPSGVNTWNYFFSDGTTQSSGYVTINAGRTLPLLAVPTPLVAYLKDVKPSGTAGGTFTAGAWRTRTLNTVEGDSQIVSLNANQFTLPSGKYEIEISSPALYVDRHQLGLQNINTSLIETYGTTEYTNITLAGGIQTRSFLKCNLILATSTSYAVVHRCSSTRADDGFGVSTPFGVPNEFTQVKITKIG